MAMDKLVQSWVDRYYYKGVGLQPPKKYPKPDTDYEMMFRRNLLQPIQAFMGKDYSVQKVPEFMTTYQQMGVATPFHILPVLSKYADQSINWSDSLKTACENFLSKAEVFWCLTKGGQLFRSYVMDGMLSGQFPVEVYQIINEDYISKTDAPNFIPNLLSKDPLAYTDTECEILRRIFNADNSYNLEQLEVEIEVADEYRIGKMRVTPVNENFPPFNLRQLWNVLPDANPYSTRHEQALEYCKEHPDEYADVKSYLEGVFDELVEDSVIHTDEGEQYNDIGEMLAAYVKEDYVCSHWTIGDCIDYYADRKEACDIFDPNNLEPNYTNDRYFTQQLKYLREYLKDSAVCEDWTLKELIALCENGDNPKDKIYNSVQELLDAGIKLSDDCIKEISGNTSVTLHSYGYNDEDIAAIEKGREGIFHHFLSNLNVPGYVAQDIALGLFSERNVCINYLQDNLGIDLQEARSVADGISNSSVTYNDVRRWMLDNHKDLSGDQIDSMLSGDVKDTVSKQSVIESGLLDSDVLTTILDLCEAGLPEDKVKQLRSSVMSNISREYLTNTGFDKTTVDELLKGNIPMVDEVTVIEQPRKPYDPFSDIESMDTRIEVIRHLEKLMVKHLEMSPDDAYLIRSKQFTKFSTKHVLELPSTEREDLAKEMVAKCLGIEASKVQFDELVDNHSVNDITLEVGSFLLKAMRKELASIDSLPMSQGIKIRVGFIPLFNSMVGFFGARGGIDEMLKSLNSVLESDSACEQAKQIVKDTMQYAHELK